MKCREVTEEEEEGRGREERRNVPGRLQVPFSHASHVASQFPLPKHGVCVRQERERKVRGVVKGKKAKAKIKGKE